MDMRGDFPQYACLNLRKYNTGSYTNIFLLKPKHKHEKICVFQNGIIKFAIKGFLTG